MIDISKLEYRLICVDPEGKQYDLTSVTNGLGWSEGEKELAAKITCKVAAVEFTTGIQPMTPLIIYADMGNGFAEVMRGTVEKVELIEANGEYYLSLEAADECLALRHNQDDLYFTEGHTSKAILEEILTKWGIPHELNLEEVKHAKKVYRQKYLSDMVSDVLKDIKEKGGGVYFIRAREGVVEILPRGTNEVIYHFDIDYNAVKVRERFDSTSLVTRVQVVAKSNEEGRQRIESTVDGKTEYGIRQVIYRRGDKETLQEAETAAKKLLEEQGDIKRETILESPDVPTIRKGDKVRVRSSAGEGYFFVKSVRHSAPEMKMTLELDADKSEYDVALTSEGTEGAP